MKRENSPLSALSLLIAAFDGMPVRGRRELRLPPEVAEQVEISVKYEGYIQRQAQEVEELQALFPAAAFQPADPTPDGKRWYWVQL